MFYSDDLLFLINDLQKNKPCEVSQFLLQLKKAKNYAYLGIEDELITFATKEQISKFYAGEDLDYYENDETLTNIAVSTINLSKIKPGRLVKKLTNQFSDTQIEKFVNNLKAFLKLRQDTSRFQIVEGEEIRKYYSTSTYQSEIGQLGKSCMRHQECQEFFNFYVENSDICKMLILRGINTDKIVGRALLWKTNHGLYLDRVYTIVDSDLILFEEYAKQLGCKWTYHKLYCSDNEKWVELKIKPKKLDFDKFPYLDTFQHYYPDRKMLTSEVIIGDRHYHEMTHTNGDLTTMVDVNIKLPPKMLSIVNDLLWI
jgi:hypothetical protein